jgi:hypothetical protein
MRSGCSLITDRVLPVAIEGGQWQPANDVEAALLQATNDGDQTAYFRILAGAPLYLPASAEAQRRGSPKLYSWTTGDLRVVPVYTSLEALAHGAGDVADAYAVTTYPELAANWPDPTWKLAVDPQLSIGLFANIDDIARGARGELTVPSATELMAAEVGDVVPANPVEEDLRAARLAGDSEAYVRALVTADVLLPVTRPVADPEEIAEPDFPWHSPRGGSDPAIAVYTSPERLAEGWPDGGPTVLVPFSSVAQFWPDEAAAMAINAGTPLEVTLPADALRELVDLLYAELTGAAHARPAVVTLQKVLPHEQVDAYLRDGRDVVTGFVYPAEELRRLTTPAALYEALGLLHPGSPFRADDPEVHVLRWPAHCPALYRLALGGPDEATRRANGGWMVEPPPFRGTGAGAGDLVRGLSPVADRVVSTVADQLLRHLDMTALIERHVGVAIWSALEAEHS